MATFDEEVFWPLLQTSSKQKMEAAAIRFANDSRYGLGAAIWSADIERRR